MYLPYPRECNPGVLLIFWVFRPRTVVYFGEKSAKITVFLADFSPKMTKVRPKYVAWGCIQDGVVFTRIRYLECQKVTKSSLFFKKFQKFSKFWFTKSRGHLSKKFTILRVLLSKILVSGRKFTKSRMFTIQWFTKSSFTCTSWEIELNIGRQ